MEESPGCRLLSAVPLCAVRRLSGLGGLAAPGIRRRCALRGLAVALGAAAALARAAATTAAATPATPAAAPPATAAAPRPLLPLLGLAGTRDRGDERLALLQL